LRGDGFHTPFTSLNGGPAGTGEVEWIGEVVQVEDREGNAGLYLCDHLNLGPLKKAEAFMASAFFVFPFLCVSIASKLCLPAVSAIICLEKNFGWTTGKEECAFRAASEGMCQGTLCMNGKKLTICVFKNMLAKKLVITMAFP
jgi:hypothetical protein